MTGSLKSWRWLSRAGGAAAAGLGVLALGGWLLGLEALTALEAGRVPMAPSTALLFLLFGGLLAGDGARSDHPAVARLALWLAVCGTGLAAILLLLSLVGTPPGWEDLGMAITGEVAGVPVGHMSPLTACGFLLAGIARLLLSPLGGDGAAGRARVRASVGCAIALLLLALVLTTAYILSRPLLYGSGVIPPALNTSLAFLLLGVSLLSSTLCQLWPAGRRVGDRPPPALPVLAALLLAVGTILAAAVLLFRDYQAHFHGEVEDQLRAVAALKVSQIEHWREELLRDATAFYASPDFAELAARALYAADPDAQARIRAWLEPVQETFRYPRISLLDTAGVSRLSVPAGSGESPHSALDARRAMAGGAPILQGFHRDRPGEPVHLTVIVPLRASGGAVLGGLVIRVDPGVYLYPMLQRWPTPSRSAETLLVRGDGDDVVFLNNLRFVAAVVPIQGCDWRLVARIDVGEAYGPLRERLAWTVAVVALLLIGVVGAVALGWQRREKVHYADLLIAQERYEVLLRSIGDAVIAADIDGRVELLNPIAEALTGWTEAEARGRPLDEVFRIVAEETREPAESPFDKVLREQRVVGLANPTLLIARDGTERPIADSGAPVRGAGGDMTGVVLVFRDQSAEREARRALAHREARYRDLFDGSRDAILVANPQRRIVDANPAFTELFGYALEQIEGSHTSIVYASGEDYERMGRELASGQGRAGFTSTVRYRRQSGDVFDGETSVFSLRDDNGTTIGFVGLIRDVTERLSAARVLRQSEERYRTLYEAAPVGIFRTHSDGGVLAVNEAMARILGFATPAAAIAHYTYLADELYVDAGRRDTFIAALREHGHVEGFEYEAVRPDGQTLWLSMNARIAARHADGAFEIEGFVTDITAQRQAEEERLHLQAQLSQSQKMESVGRLAGGVAHDFNNMLTVILGHARLALNRAEADAQLRASLEAIREAAERSADLTRQLLAFGRAQIASPRVLDINDTVAGMLQMLRRLIGENIELAWQPGAAIWPVRIDPAQVDQILVNLIVNARDAIDGVGRITISTATLTLDVPDARSRPDAEPGDYVALLVTDDGCGMDGTTLAQIFEPFFTTKPLGEGTGLGLSTVHGIVRQNGGFVSAYSEPGQGTTMRIYLPRCAAGPAAVGDGAAPAPLAGGSETILLVEDQPALLQVSQQMLEELGYTVLPAPGPDAAQRLLTGSASPVDLLVTDVVMPQMNGRELAERLRTLRPGLRALFMSGYPANIIGHHGVLEEGTHFLEKPFTAAELASGVRAALDAP